MSPFYLEEKEHTNFFIPLMFILREKPTGAKSKEIKTTSIESSVFCSKDGQSFLYKILNSAIVGSR